MLDEERPSHLNIDLLRSYAEDQDAETRAYGVGELSTNGPVSWDDIEKWISEADEDVRMEVISALQGPGAAFDLRRTDDFRTVDLLRETIARYADGAAADALMWMSQESNRMLELTWAAADRLQRIENRDVYSAVLIGYFEHVIVDQNFGPDDPHIRPWIEKYDIPGRSTLFNVASWTGLGDGQLRKIMKVLSRDSDPETASAARKLLDRNEPKDQPKLKLKPEVKQEEKSKKGRKPGKPRWSESKKENEHDN